jgi:segregation and condensation protein B
MNDENQNLPKADAPLTDSTLADPTLEGLTQAAAEWAPEARETEVSSETVTFVSDPFHLGVLDVSEAQRMEDEPLDLEDLAESDDLLQALSETLEKEEAKQVEELLETQQESAQEAQERLAAEIAEDEALQAALAQEASETEEEVDPELAAALPQLPQPDESGALDLSELRSCIETLLFMTDKPMSLTRLQELLGPDFPHSLFQEAVTALRDEYQRPSHGFELVEVAGGLQFRTKAGRAALAKKLAKVQTQRLSSGAMETLAIVAFKQPVLKEDIDQIRGVDSSHFVRTLMDRKLIAIQGRSDLPGKPMVYGTTADFLELFGLKDLQALPSLRELEQMVPASQSEDPEADDPRVKEMRRLVAQMKADNTRLAYDPREDEKILKDIREKVNLIPTSTPWLDDQKAQEKAAQELAKEEAKRAAAGLPPLEAASTEPTGELPLPIQNP